MRIVFLGSGAFGLPALQALARAQDAANPGIGSESRSTEPSTERSTVAMVVTQPDRKAGRGGRLTPTPLGAWAAEHLPAVPLLKPERVNEPSILAQIRAADADAWVVIAFGQKLNSSLLADRFAINLHASLLPRWRGAAPINAAILAGDTTTGNSVITLADRMDAGLVLGQSQHPINPTTTAGELHDLLAADGPALVLRVLAERQSGTLGPVEQDESLVTLAPKLSRADGWVDFWASAEACRRRINGLSPWPGVQATLGDQALKLVRAQADQAGGMDHPPTNTPPGTLLDPARGTVACDEGTLQLLEIQPAGKRPMAWADFARGRSLEPGTPLEPVGGPEPC